MRIFYLCLILLATSGFAVAETAKKTDPPVEKNKTPLMTQRTSVKDTMSLKQRSILDRTLNKIPDITKDARKEEISTRPAAVTRAGNRGHEKLPLIWKLEKEPMTAPTLPDANGTGNSSN